MHPVQLTLLGTKFQKPFLKWAGGKFRILNKILPEIPTGKRFVEPFAGSAAVYLNFPCEQALVCDVNRDLIRFYIALRDRKKVFVDYCRSFFTKQNNTKDTFIKLRELYNNSTDDTERCALLLYLNRHAFNGLIRYNSKGGYNVPFGKYKAPYFPEKELLAFIDKTERTETQFLCQDFRTTFSQLRPGDIVYCDPPYIPLSTTANFTTYSGKPFLEDDQKELSELAYSAFCDGIPVVLSNHDTKMSRQLYCKAKIIDFDVQRFISCNGSGRDAVPEIIAAYR